jgi:hypothetical protein
VGGMETLSVKAIVSADYMAKISKKRNRGKAGAAEEKEVQLDATDKEVTLEIRSDLVVWKGSLPQSLPNASQLPNMFLNCRVNVEMKKNWLF